MDEKGSHSSIGKSLPSYTSIDLEHELSEIFSTNLNPHIRDPDMSTFYATRINKDQRSINRNPPPTLYPVKEEIVSKKESYHNESILSSRYGLIIFGMIFFTIPLIILLFFAFTESNRHRIIY